MLIIHNVIWIVLPSFSYDNYNLIKEFGNEHELNLLLSLILIIGYNVNIDCGGSWLHLKIIVELDVCVLRCYSDAWTNKQPGIQQFWYSCGHYQDIYDWISPLNKQSGSQFILTPRAGFRRGQSGQLPRGPHKKGPPQISIMLFEYYGILLLRKICKFQSSLICVCRQFWLIMSYQ